MSVNNKVFIILNTSNRRNAYKLSKIGENVYIKTLH